MRITKNIRLVSPVLSTRTRFRHLRVTIYIP